MTNPAFHSESYRVVISGGGTGGHLFPALAIARQLQTEVPNTEILFVGAKGRMEMDKVPAHGYQIKGLWIAGFIRGAFFKNLLLPAKLVVSFIKAWTILRKFKPRVAIGTGGFASGPLLFIASRMGIPTLIQEQNFFPGLTNRLLSKYVDRVCGVYEELKDYFGKHKLVITGNPVREELNDHKHGQGEARVNFGLSEHRPTFIATGGSLGATTLNQALERALPHLAQHGIQGIWQTGPGYHKAKGSELQSDYQDHIAIQAFISDMPQAYKAADLVICRAGAITLAELAYLGKPALLVPSPNVAADHQTKNAKVLEDHDAAILIPDDQATQQIPALLPTLLKDTHQLKTLSTRIQDFARPDATKHITREIFNLVQHSEIQRSNKKKKPLTNPSNP